MENFEHQSPSSKSFLKNVDERYKLLVKSLDAIEDYAIFLLDADGYIITWNHGARRIKGYFESEIIGKHFSIFYTEADKKRHHPEFELHIARDRGRFEEEGWRLRKSGEKFWANVVINALKDEHGNVIAFSKVTRDLTEKKLAEEKIRQSEERYRLLVESVQDYGIFMLDLKGNIKTWNAGAEIILGYKAPDVIGKHFSIFFTEEELIDAKPQMELNIASGPAGRFQNSGWAIRKEGNRIRINGLISPMRNDKNEIIGFTKVVRDLTEKNKIEDLEDSIRMRDEFISVASHELRTPVTKLLLNIQLIKKTADSLNERVCKSLNVCEQSTKELIGLMDNLVDVTRLRLGKLEIRRTKTNFTTVVLNVITKFKDPIRLHGNQLSFNHEGDIVGYWDQTRLEQLISNLLSNAVKFSEGKPIRMELKTDQENVHFSISDEGPGIPYNLQPRVFERFERFVDVSKVGGLGLGLYVAKQIVVAHKGDITLESHPGKGTKFSITIPLKQRLA